MQHGTISQPASRGAARPDIGFDIATRRDAPQQAHGPRRAAPADSGPSLAPTVMGPGPKLRTPRPGRTTTASTTTQATATFAPQAQPACAPTLGRQWTALSALVWASRAGALVASASRVVLLFAPGLAGVAFGPVGLGVSLVLWTVSEVVSWLLTTGTQTAKRTLAGTAAGACAIALLAPAAAPAAILAGAAAGGVLAYQCTDWQGLVVPAGIFAILFVSQQVLST